MLKICVLASGSSGNSTLIRAEKTAVLLDAGLSAAALIGKLGTLGLTLEDLDAVLIGHDHGDHTQGLKALGKRWGGPIYLNRETAEAVKEKAPGLGNLHIFQNQHTWEIGDIRVSPFPVEHDALNPVGFVLECGGVRVAAATDLGFVTRPVREAFRGVHAAIIEANYDPGLLLNGSRPWHLKQRIKSRRGHLSNGDAADFLGEVCGETVSDVFLVHLSRDCNRPDLALQAVKEALARKGRPDVRVHLTYPDRPSPEVAIASMSPGKIIAPAGQLEMML